MFNKFVILVSIYLSFIIVMSIILGIFGAGVDVILESAGCMLAAPFGILLLLTMGGVEMSYNPSQEEEKEHGKENTI